VLALEAVSSFTRGLHGACTALALDGDSLVGGSHDGQIVRWSPLTGEKKWGLDVEGPISDMHLAESLLFVSSSSMLSCLSVETGEVLWRSNLEGASDYVVQTGNVVWATSSVYEIEVSDYVESTLWAFDLDGSKLNSWSFEERCWFLAPHPEEGVVMGLGRPRCGYLWARAGVDLSHFDLAVESPVTTGAEGSNGILFGHSNGAISDLSGMSLIDSEASIRSLAIFDGGSWAYGTDEGTVGGEGWKASAGGLVDAIVPKPGKSGAWAISWSGSSSFHSIGDSFGDSEITHRQRISSFAHEGDRIAMGDENGRIFSINADFLERRMSDGPSEGPDDGRSSHLRDRLRRLRE